MRLKLTEQTKQQIALNMCSIYGDYETTAEAMLMQFVANTKDIKKPTRGYCFICEEEVTDECTKH